MDSIDARLTKATEDFFKEFKGSAPKAGTAPSGRDFYQEREDENERERRKSYPNGAMAKLITDVNNAIKPLVMAFNVAKRNYDRLKERGDKARARMVADQYMQERFLPAIEAVVRMNSADELLNAAEAMRKLDDFVLIPGGSAHGYTKAYVRSLYENEIGDTMSKTDAVVERCLREINDMLAAGQLRTAIGKATKMVDAIDNGKNMAEPADYELLQKVIARGQ